VLNLFKNDRIAKAYQAILADDKDKLLKQLQKIKATEINNPSSETTPGLVEACIIQQRPKLLTLVLAHGASPTGISLNDIPFAALAFQQENSLSLLTALLQAGNNEKREPLLNLCFDHCPPTQRMMHISLLLQHGAKINDTLLTQALVLGERPLIHFLINSGAILPTPPPDDTTNEEMLVYARKCAEDLKIRQMFL
jgi:hypothetical protein